MTPETYGRIHESFNLSVLLLVEVAAALVVWWALPAPWLRMIVFPVIFLAVLYFGHRFIPKITGPVVDRLIKHKVAHPR
ncbi:MAG TPA: hypothetical protein VGB25_11060 [Candidatus Binatia bacterium]